MTSPRGGSAPAPPIGSRAGGPRSSWLPLTSILAVTFIGTVSNTIVNVPLGVILQDFGVPLSSGALIVTAWSIGLAALMPIMGWLGDRFGRRRVFLVATAVMITSLFGATVAPNLWVLVLCRTIQGCASAAILPNVMSLIGEMPIDRARGLSGWALANSLGQAVGAPLGGWLSDFFGWRSIFWPLGVAGLVALVIGIKVVPRSQPIPDTIFDWRGAALLTTSVGVTLSGISIAPSQGVISPATLALVAIGVVGIVGFVLHVRGAAAPFVPLPVVWQRTFVAGSVAAFSQMFCLGATVVAVPYWLTGPEDLSTATAGLITFALPAAMALLAPFSGMTTARFTPPPTIWGGMTVLILAQLSLALVTGGAGTTGLLLVLVMVANGIGIAFVQTPAATLASTSVKGVGAGIGVFNMMRFSGSLTGAAWVAVAIQSHQGYPTVFLGCAATAAVGLAVTLIARRRDVTTRVQVDPEPQPGT